MNPRVDVSLASVAVAGCGCGCICGYGCECGCGRGCGGMWLDVFVYFVHVSVFLLSCRAGVHWWLSLCSGSVRACACACALPCALAPVLERPHVRERVSVVETCVETCVDEILTLFLQCFLRQTRRRGLCAHTVRESHVHSAIAFTNSADMLRPRGRNGIVHDKDRFLYVVCYSFVELSLALLVHVRAPACTYVLSRRLTFLFPTF